MRLHDRTGPAPALRRPQVQLMLVLAEAGCRFVVVGGTARFLRGAPRLPRDLDVVVARDHLPGLRAALTGSIAPAARAPSGTPSPQRVLTGWSPLDVFVEDDEPEAARFEVDGVEVRVAHG